MAYELLLGACRWTLLRTVSSATQEADATLVPVQMNPVQCMIQTARDLWSTRQQALPTMQALQASDQPAENETFAKALQTVLDLESLLFYLLFAKGTRKL